MTTKVGGIDPHQATFSAAVIDSTTALVASEVFDNTGDGYIEAIDWFNALGVIKVGVEGSAKWGAHISIALAGAGIDVREVPPERAAAQRSIRRLAKTDAIDALSTARALAAEPDLGPAQVLEIYDPLVAEIEAVLEHRRALVATRTLMLQHIGDQIAKLPTPVRDFLTAKGPIEQRLRRLNKLDLDHIENQLPPSGTYRLTWLRAYLDTDRAHATQIRALERHLNDLLDEHGTTLRDETGIGTIGAATLLCEIGDPTRFATESRFASWTGTSPIAITSGEGRHAPTKHRLNLGGNRRVNSVIHITSITQQRDLPIARDYITRKTSQGKTRRSARRSHKRLIANHIIRRMWKDEQQRTQTHHPKAA